MLKTIKKNEFNSITSTIKMHSIIKVQHLNISHDIFDILRINDNNTYNIYNKHNLLLPQYMEKLFAIQHISFTVLILIPLAFPLVFII